MSTKLPISTLIEVMAALRDPVSGCPWDREQDFASIAPYTVEEAYEVQSAIAANDPAQLKDELGDLLFRWSTTRGWRKSKAGSISTM